MLLHRIRRVLLLTAAVSLPLADVQGSDVTSDLLGRAETAVTAARAKQALWLEAVRAVVAARAALNRGDFDESERQSRWAIELSELGLLQRDAGTGPAAPQARRDR